MSSRSAMYLWEEGETSVLVCVLTMKQDNAYCGNDENRLEWMCYNVRRRRGTCPAGRR